MKKLTQQEVLARCKAQHGKRYDYTRVKYKGVDTPIVIVCRTHGPFKQNARAHYEGQGCPKCSPVAARTTEWFIREAEKTHGNLYAYDQSRYVNQTVKVKIKCKEHGVFTQLPRNHISGMGCKKCFIERDTFTQDDFVRMSRGLHGDKYDYSRAVYKGSQTKITVVCPKHGPWRVTAIAHYKMGYGCDSCAREGGSAYKVKRCVWKGRKILYQGYELLGARWLVKNRKVEPEDIHFSRVGNVPRIRYQGADGKQHTHYPDMFIPKIKRIVEVKSVYTASIDSDLHLKKKAAQSLGFGYTILIMNPDGTRAVP